MAISKKASVARAGKIRDLSEHTKYTVNFKVPVLEADQFNTVVQESGKKKNVILENWITQFFKEEMKASDFESLLEYYNNDI